MPTPEPVKLANATSHRAEPPVTKEQLCVKHRLEAAILDAVPPTLHIDIFREMDVLLALRVAVRHLAQMDTEYCVWALEAIAECLRLDSSGIEAPRENPR